MGVVAAAVALLLDVRDLAVRRHFTVVAGHAPACQRSEAEETNKAHHAGSLVATGSNSCTAEFVAIETIELAGLPR
jgi:hypothetical protein